MEIQNKKIKKRGLTALLITGAIVGIGMGTNHVIKKVAQQKAKSDEITPGKSALTKKGET